MSELWSNSIELMLLGMGSVFTFLLLLVIGVTIMSALINRFSPASANPIKHNKTKSNTLEAEVAAVAAAAWATSRTSTTKAKTS
jgi:oxaloacetate decarboxylase gamma subunit